MPRRPGPAAAGAFAVARQLAGARRWKECCEAGLPLAAAGSGGLAAALADWLAVTPLPPELHPCLADLLRFEALCDDLRVAARPRLPSGLQPGGCLLAGRPLLNPVRIEATFDWPVQRIGPRYRRPAVEGLPVRLLLFRNVVGGVDSLPACDATRALVTSLERRRLSGRRQLEDLAAGQGGDAAAALRGWTALVERLRAAGLVLGALPV